ncbi:DUF481 domain-containing protein [Sulfurimonas sp.]|uniref:DUF481 domain-containing protein n=1 Tax=Sulfurimonas sp. TaxID=2022749 RepID=UPI00262E99EB|nr:DUF481 domain-containing protein [Sulfurimonas sp.]
MKYLILIFVSIVNLYAVVSIAPINIGEKPGVSGALKGSFETQRGNARTDNYSASAKVQYDNNSSYVMWTEVAFNYGKSSGIVNTNNSFTHLRYIHTTYVEELNWESFLQSQTNEFTNVKDRYLAGVGLRYFINKSQYGKVYVGLGTFYEFLSYTTQIDPVEHNNRLNAYISYSKELGENTKLTYLVYIQPSYADFSDYVLKNAFELKIRIYEKLYLNFTISYNEDTKPAIGIKRTDAHQKTSFLYEF